MRAKPVLAALAALALCVLVVLPTGALMRLAVTSGTSAAPQALGPPGSAPPGAGSGQQTPRAPTEAHHLRPPKNARATRANRPGSYRRPDGAPDGAPQRSST